MYMYTRLRAPAYSDSCPVRGENSLYLDDGLTTLNIQMHISWGAEE